MKKLLLSILTLSSFGVNAQFWTEKATGFTTPARSLNSISIVDANVIWANAFDNTTPSQPNYTIHEFTRSMDGGNTWTPGSIDLGENTIGLAISSLTAISTTTAWVSVADDNYSGLGGIWKTTDEGINWEKQPTALFSTTDESYPNFVHFWDANNGIAQGDPESGEFEIYTTNDGGTTWNKVAGTNIPDPIADEIGEYGYYNLYTVSGNTIWFGTDRGRIFKSDDMGLNWTAYQSPSSDFGHDSFTFSDGNKGILMTNNPASLHSTTDGGATWNPISTTGFFNSEASYISYIPGTSTVISGSSADPYGSSYSKDDGLTWTNIDNAFHGTLAFLNSSFGFSAGMNTSDTEGGIFKFEGIPLKINSFETKKIFTVYPNPANGVLQINSEKTLIRNVDIFDLSGKHVLSSNYSDINQPQIDIKSLETGIYMVKITSDTRETATLKFMKN